ncbi:hypothetical protein H4582DRAFT_2089338 [Lactarius indigo]|nr:hypothetical protein H4582DRAFT_2089338 [Lactarius indigo]
MEQLGPQRVASRLDPHAASSVVPNHVSRSCDPTSSRLGSGYHSEREVLSVDETGLATHEATGAVIPGEDGDEIVPEDLADAEDTDTFDILATDVNFSSLASPNLEPPDATLSSAPPLEGHLVTGTEPSHPGASLPSMTQGPSMHEAMRNALGDATMHGPSSSAVTELLAIPEVVERLGLSYSTSNELNSIIDKLPGPPPFKSDVLEHFSRSPSSHETLYLPLSDTMPTLSGHVGSTVRCIPGDWWWSVQTSLESIQPGATVVPVIISSDKTQLTLFRWEERVSDLPHNWKYTQGHPAENHLGEPKC